MVKIGLKKTNGDLYDQTDKLSLSQFCQRKKNGEEKYWNIDGTLNSITVNENGEQIEIRVYKPNYINSTDTTTYKGDIIWRKQ